MNFRIFSHKPLRSLVLGVAGGSLLAVGCMQNSRSMVARDLSAEKQKKSRATAGMRSTNPFAQTGKITVPAPRRSTRSGNVFASFFGPKPGETDPAVDPFLEADTVIAQSSASVPAPASSASMPQATAGSLNPFGFLNRQAAEPSAPATKVAEATENPFEALKRERQQETSRSEPAGPVATTADASPAQFAEGFDSQLDRLRAALNNDVKQTSLSGPAEPQPEEDRRRVESLVAEARTELDKGNITDAYRIAQEADALAREAGVILGPDSEHPADLLAILQAKLETPAEEAEGDWRDAEPVADVPAVTAPPADCADDAEEVVPVVEEVSTVDALIAAQEAADPFSRPVPDFGGMIVDSDTVPPRIASSAMRPVTTAVWSDRGRTFSPDGLDPGKWAPQETEVRVSERGIVRASANRGIAVASASEGASMPKLAAPAPEPAAAAQDTESKSLLQADQIAADAEPVAAVVTAENVEWSETPVPVVQEERSAVSGLAIFALVVAGLGGGVVWLWRRRAYQLARKGR